MIAFLKKIPWWIWVALFVAILFLWQSISGFAYSNKLWNMVKDEIVSREKEIIEDLERQNAIDEKEKEDLYRQVNNLKNQRAELQKEKDRLLVRNEELTHALQNVSVPSDPNALLELLHQLGLKSARRGTR